MKTEKQAYTVREIASMTGFSRQTITRIFEKERDVLVVARPEELHKRRYKSIRIPRAVYERVIRGISV
jgi:predicted transcriptional regulator